MKTLWAFAIAIVIGLSGCVTPSHPMAYADSTLNTNKKAKAMNHYLNSIIGLKRGQYTEAIEDLRKSADIDEGSALLQMRLLAIYYRDEDYENAAIMAERAIERAPDSIILHIMLGRIYNQLERTEDSIETFQKAITLDPESNVVYEALAKVEEESNDLVGAVEVYESMIERQPRSAILHYRLGINLMEMNDSEGARYAIERALALDPTIKFGWYVLGVIQMDLDNWAEAEKAFVEHLSTNPDHTATFENMASIQAQQGSYIRAFDILGKLIESKHVNVNHHLQRTYVYLRDPEASDSYIASAPNDAPIMGSLLQILVKRNAGEPYAAILKSLDTLEGDLDFECNAYLGSLMGRYGNEEAGAFLSEQLKTLLEEGGKSKTVLTVLGRTLMYMEQAEKGLAQFEQVLKTYGGDKWTHFYIATAYEAMDDPKQCEAHLRKTLEFDPNDPDVLNFLSYLLAEQDDHLKEAKEMVERALLNDPENGFYLDTLGWIYYRQGKGKEAVANIKRAIRAMNSDDAVLRDHLGDAYLISGDKKKAVAEWKRAIRLDPELEGVTEKIENYSKK